MAARSRSRLYDNLIVYVDDRIVQYLTDTLPGSSGSPCFDSEWKVIALHHSGGWLREPGAKERYYRNEGIHINKVIDGLAAAGLLKGLEEKTDGILRGGSSPLRDVLADSYLLAALALGRRGRSRNSAAVRSTLEGPAIQFWTNNLVRAQNNNQVQDVIDIARKHFPRNEKLIDAETRFHTTPIPDSSNKQSPQPREPEHNEYACVVIVGDITGNGNAIVSGENVTVNNHSNRAVFDQRNQKVTAQYKVAGDVQQRCSNHRTSQAARTDQPGASSK